MCKIFAMTNMTKINVNTKFINAVKNQVCRTSDKDGFGWAVLGQDGSIGGERTIRPFQFKPLSGTADKVVSKLPIVLKSSDSFGELSPANPKSFVGHGRLSTNTVSLENTHPYVNDNCAMIHNGVVTDLSKRQKDLKTNNDTEILFNYWNEGGIKDVEAHVGGYYAFVVLDKSGHMHIVRDDQAMLYVSYCTTVDSYIFATTAEIILGVAKAMKWQIESPEEMLPNTYALFNGNELVEYTEFEPESYDYMSRYDSSGDYNSKRDGIDLSTYLEQDPEDAPVPAYKDYAQDDPAHMYTEITKDWARDHINGRYIKRIA